MAENFYGLTDTGKQRQDNEDAFIAQLDANSRYIIACVIDGVGGYSGGEVAAALARETILWRLSKIDGQIIPLLTDALQIANDKISHEKLEAKKHDSMACVATLALVDLTANQFYYAHVGDTRLYLLRDETLVKISHDQSFVGFLEDSGRLTEMEAMKHPKRNEIDKALGFKNTDIQNGDYLETGQSPFLPGDTLLLCSDGLTDMVDKEAICNILTTKSSLKTKCTSLVNAANQNGGKDNITVVLVENNKPKKKHEATMPAGTIQQQPEPPAVSAAPDIRADSSYTVPERPSPTKTIIGFLILVVLGLAAVCIWQYFNYHKPVQVAIAVPVKKAPNAQQIKLQQAINNCKGNYLLLPDTVFRSPVLISAPITINRDTLHIKAMGNIILQSDSGYNGPAFNLSANNKHIVLDSLSFRQFNVAVAGYNNNVELNNVRFFNCRQPLQNTFSFPDGKYVNGSTSFALFVTDSLAKTKLPYGAR
ncbi:PP2C family protein-serine/threonine phosphatase [Mucilaginibacter sp. AW1-3]